MVDTIVGGIRDCVFFLVVGFLGFHKIIGEPILAALLSAYTAHRFGVSMGKQQAIISLSSGGTGGTGGTGGSGTMRAVVPPPTPTRDSHAVTRRIDQRREPDPEEKRTESGSTLDTGAYQVVAKTVGGIV